MCLMAPTQSKETGSDMLPHNSKNNYAAGDKGLQLFLKTQLQPVPVCLLMNFVSYRYIIVTEVAVCNGDCIKLRGVSNHLSQTRNTFKCSAVQHIYNHHTIELNSDGISDSILQLYQTNYLVVNVEDGKYNEQ